MSQVYQSQLVITVRQHYLQIAELSGHASKHKKNSFSVALPPGVVKDVEIVNFEVMQNILKIAFNRMKLKGSTYKIIFVMKSIRTINFEFGLDPSENLERAVKRILAEKVPCDETNLSYHCLGTRKVHEGLKQFQLFVTRIDILDHYRKLLNHLDIEVAHVEFQTPCLLTLIYQIRDHKSQSLRLYNIGDGYLQSVSVEKGEISGFVETALTMVEDEGTRKAALFAALEVLESRSNEAETRLEPELVFVNTEGALFDEYIKSQGRAHPPRLVQVEPLKNIFVNNSTFEVPAGSGPVSNKKPEPNEFSEEYASQTSVGRRHASSALPSGGGARFDQKAAPAATAAKPLKIHKPIPMMKVFLGIAAAAAVGIMLYQPESGDIKTVKNEVFDDPYVMVGLPKAPPERYREILKYLEESSTKAQMAGTPFPDSKRAQLEFLREEKAKNAF